jgi:hypothetical protein
MLGYTGWFSKTFSADSLAAGNYDIVDTPTCAIVTSIYFEDHAGANRGSTSFVWEIECLQNTGAATIVPIWSDAAGAYAAVATYGGGLTAALPLGNTRQYLEGYPARFVASSGYVGIGARLAVTSAGNFTYRMRVRPYHFTGWQNANLTGASALTAVEPGITNTALGRSSSYANEIALAKDAIRVRLVNAGIDPDEIPTDGVATISSVTTPLGASVNPQTIATYLIPELCDPATYLTLSLIYERMAQAPDDMNSFRAAMHRQRYEDAMAAALKILPMNLDSDYTLSKPEETAGVNPVLVR